MRVLFITAATAAVLSIAVGPAQSQAVPDLNVDPVCHGIAQQAANPSEKGGPDLAFSKCVQSEQAMRQKLVNEWSTFLPTEKTNCIGDQMGGMASYTDLVSCLEMAKDARQLKSRQVNKPAKYIAA
jgi:hypothetical protein